MDNIYWVAGYVGTSKTSEMANPRKFSEKIALHNQKQAEETAAFEQIMKEVIGATRVNMLWIFIK